MTDLYKITDRIAETNQANGWHDRWHRLVAQQDADAMLDHAAVRVALIGTEVSEALEELRDHGLDGSSLGTELADVVIRTLDVAALLGIDLPHEITQKVERNATRGHMHGGKRL